MNKRAAKQWVGFNQKNRDQWVEQVAKSLPAKNRILDVGAGPGRYRELFSHCQYFSQDFGEYQGTKEGLLKDNWKYGDLDFQCDATAIPVEDGSFDAVLCTEVLEHVPEPIEVLREIGRIVRPGGKAFITAPLGSGIHQAPYHFYGGFSPFFYEKFLADFGFKQITVTPNGRFFRMLLQELHRGVGIIQKNFSYPIWHPKRWLLLLLGSPFLARWLTRLDDTLLVDEFTIGYHVEAIKGGDQ